MPAFPLRFNVGVTGVEEVRLFLFGIRQRSMNMASWLDRIAAEYLYQDTLANFRAGGRPRRWMPLAESTKYQRRLLGFPEGPPLIRSGLLLKTATQRGYRGATLARWYQVVAENIHRVRPLSLIIGTTHPGGFYAQHMYSRIRRPFYYPSQETMKNLIRSARLFITQRALVKGPPWR